jgi:hypothetical protein
MLPSVAPEMGLAVFPDAPVYHWTVMGRVPFAVTVSVMLWPDEIVADDGLPLIVGGVQIVTVAVALSADPQLLDTRAQ